MLWGEEILPTLEGDFSEIWSEPYFDELAGEWDLYHTLCYWALLEEVLAQLPPNTSRQVHPVSATIFGVSFECTSLWEYSRPVDSVEGVHLKRYSKQLFRPPPQLFTTQAYTFHRSLKITSGKTALMHLDLTSPTGVPYTCTAHLAPFPPSNNQHSTTAPSSSPRSLPPPVTHGLLLWVEFPPPSHLHSPSSSSSCATPLPHWSSAPPQLQQGSTPFPQGSQAVFLLNEPLSATQPLTITTTLSDDALCLSVSPGSTSRSD
ncbi:hypothetical protein Pelo_10203 [Pelomyxa schiedti]|nr:hypothetical protein Pelo_10203 [Pelomyxa schiedti]